MIEKPQVDDYLYSLAMKDDVYTDYEVLIYNLKDEHINQLYNNYQQTTNLELKSDQIQYDYNNIMLAQRLNILKFQLHALHSDSFQAQQTLIKILEINDQILNNCENYIDVKAYMLMQNFVLDYYQRYQRIFSEEQKNEINLHISKINIDELWQHLLTNEYSFKIKQYSHLYNIPLLINKDEMKNIEYFYFLQKVQKPLEKVNIVDSKFHRSNFVGLGITQVSYYPSSS